MIPPGPDKPVALQTDTLQTMEALVREYGGIVTVGPQTYLVSEPDLIEEILVERPSDFRKGRSIQRIAPLLGRGLLLLEGEEWRKHRRLVQPAFARVHLEGMGPTVVSVTESHLARWPAQLDVYKALVQLLMELTIRNIFQQEVTSDLRQLMESWELLFAHMSNRFADLAAPPPEVVEAKRCVDETLWQPPRTKMARC
jgi:cytochrome P450